MICSLIVVVDQRDLRHDHRLDPGPRRIPRQGGGQRGHRPALRAADDRRRPHPARPLRERQPVRHRHRPHPDRGRRGAALRHPPLRRPRGAAAADRDGPRDGGGGGLARRRRLHRSSAASSSPTCCPASPPASPSPSPGRSASSARSCSSPAACRDTQVSSVFIRSRSSPATTAGAAAVSVVLLRRLAAAARRDQPDPALEQPPRTQQRRRPDRDADERRGLQPPRRGRR